MKNIKTKIGIIILGILMILGIGTISNAYNLGDVIYISYGNYSSNNNLYCLQHGQSLTTKATPYKVISKIDITGNTSKDTKGKEITDWNNAKLVGIISSNKPKFYERANAIWSFGPTWMSQVGKHYGLSVAFATSTEKPGPTDVLAEAEAYANSIKDTELKIKDNTDKSKITAKAETYNDKSYTRVGPFNWTFPGTLKEISVYNQDDKTISGVKYSTWNGKEQNIHKISEVQSNKNFYIWIPSNGKTAKITKVTAKTEATIRSAHIEFYQSLTQSFQNMMEATPSTTNKELENSFKYNIELLGDLKVIKVDKDDNTVTLKDVGFIIQRKDDGKYIHRDAKGNITYVAKDKATEFITDDQGQITIKNLLVGTYVAYETKNPNYGYEIIKDGKQKNVVVDKTAELKIPNKQKYIKLSGYVWIDKLAEVKDTTQDTNGLYKDNAGDIHDELKSGITVKLVDKTTKEVVTETKTDNNGAYLFSDVLIDKLGDYYIEFIYDGISYQNVVPNLDKDNGSKAIEGDSRTAFNNEFASIEGTGQTTGVSKDSNGKVTHELSYTKYGGNAGDNSYTSRFNNDGSYTIDANTDKAGYNIDEHRVAGQTEIKNINLGLKERKDADLSVIKDLSNAKVSINGYDHTYYYEQAIAAKEDAEYDKEGFNVSVKFGRNDANQPYTRAIYPSDVNYKQENGTDKELKVYITYKIGLKNKSMLDAKVNSIVDYYDARYTLVKAGTTMNEKGEINDDLTPAETDRRLDSGNEKYSKAIIQTNKDIQKEKTEYVYVQFELNRDAILAIMDSNGSKIVEQGETNENLLENVVEINSYSNFEDGKIYAAIDKNSNPGNTTPGNIETYEDDTDISPALKLETADARKLTGTVFLDNSGTADVKTGKIREGNGILEDGEKGIEKVKMLLTEHKTNTTYGVNVETDANGNFTIVDFIPGQYTLTYTWGDNTYTVDAYKGTIYNNKERQDKMDWYKTDTKRYSDAKDNWETRKKIDEETAKGGDRTITTMDSTTPKMELALEYDALITASRGDKYEYLVKDIDFGIVERAKQKLGLEKYVKSIKIVLQDGQTLIDGTYNKETKKFEGEVSGLTGGVELGYVKAEIDSELLEGSTAYITYEMITTNISEADYVSENGDYYLYGYEQSKGNLGEIVKIKVGEMEDHLDNTLIYDNKDNKWKVITIEDGKGKTILVTEEFVNTKLEPTQTVSIELPTSKLLSNEEEIYFNNDVTVLNPKSTTDLIVNYGPKVESPIASAEEVTITTPTGENRNYIVPIAIGMTTLVIFGVGIVIIKKKVI